MTEQSSLFTCSSVQPLLLVECIAGWLLPIAGMSQPQGNAHHAHHVLNQDYKPNKNKMGFVNSCKVMLFAKGRHPKDWSNTMPTSITKQYI